jgi:hypothetical protein
MLDEMKEYISDIAPGKEKILKQHDNRISLFEKFGINKQIKTLHSKLKKNDTVYTEYSIEKDRIDNKYHIHLIFNYTNEQNLNDTLSNYIGGSDWKKREMGLDTFNECNGKYGLIHTEDIIDIQQYRRYINKTNISNNLI